jgi:hypothetical protein
LHKQADQSAFAVRPARTSGAEWFYVAAAVMSLLALLLGVRSLPARPRPRPALLLDRSARGGRHGRRR